MNSTELYKNLCKTLEDEKIFDLFKDLEFFKNREKISDQTITLSCISLFAKEFKKIENEKILNNMINKTSWQYIYIFEKIEKIAKEIERKIKIYLEMDKSEKEAFLYIENKIEREIIEEKIKDEREKGIALMLFEEEQKIYLNTENELKRILTVFKEKRDLCLIGLKNIAKNLEYLEKFGDDLEKFEKILDGLENIELPSLTEVKLQTSPADTSTNSKTTIKPEIELAPPFNHQVKKEISEDKDVKNPSFVRSYSTKNNVPKNKDSKEYFDKIVENIVENKELEEKDFYKVVKEYIISCIDTYKKTNGINFKEAKKISDSLYGFLRKVNPIKEEFLENIDRILKNFNSEDIENLCGLCIKSCRDAKYVEVNLYFASAIVKNAKNYHSLAASLAYFKEIYNKCMMANNIEMAKNCLALSREAVQYYEGDIISAFDSFLEIKAINKKEKMKIIAKNRKEKNQTQINIEQNIDEFELIIIEETYKNCSFTRNEILEEKEGFSVNYNKKDCLDFLRVILEKKHFEGKNLSLLSEVYLREFQENEEEIIKNIFEVNLFLEIAAGMIKNIDIEKNKNNDISILYNNAYISSRIINNSKEIINIEKDKLEKYSECFKIYLKDKRIKKHLAKNHKNSKFRDCENECKKALDICKKYISIVEKYQSIKPPIVKASSGDKSSSVRLELETNLEQLSNLSSRKSDKIETMPPR